MCIVTEKPDTIPKDIEMNINIFSVTEFFKLLARSYIGKIERMTETRYIKITVYYSNKHNGYYWDYFVSPQTEDEEKLINDFTKIVNKSKDQKEQSVVVYAEDKTYTVKLFDPK